MATPDLPVSLQAKLALFDSHWTPHTIAEFNGNHLKVAKVEGTFQWHAHDDTDEVFLVLAGELTIEMDGRNPAVLGTGDLFVVPRGLRHRPIAHDEAQILLIEPAGVPNTGDPDTATEERWI
jgi:mannose-6-phosphate isomerase-like protein (cupin superfamily)